MTLDQRVQSIVDQLFDLQPVTQQQTFEIIKYAMNLHLEQHQCKHMYSRTPLSDCGEAT